MEMQHDLHEQPLKLVRMGEDDGETVQTCAGCNDELSGEVLDACNPRGFQLHQFCGSLPHKVLEICDEAEEHLLHFSHPHPLKLNNYKEVVELDADQLRCNGCKKPISGKLFACYTCGYYLHEFCGNLPLEIQHFFHPCTLFLEITNSWVNCDACLGKCSEMIDFGYHCKKCNFKMHWECAQLPPIGSDDGGDKIRHLSHHHPLKLNSGESRVEHDSLECNLCRRGITGQVYGTCDPCQFYIHKSCMVPEEIRHRCHPCPLFLRLVKKFDCNICLRKSRHCFTYQCIKCHFNMHVECADLSSSAIIGDDDRGEHILHFCHQHPLQPFEDLKRNTRDMILNKRLQCFVCESLSSGLTYGCKDCDVFLHKPCLDILPQILSIQNEPSVLVRLALRERCAKCYKSFSGFFFVCKPNYYCVPCALLGFLSFRVNPSSVWIEHPFHRCPLILKLLSTFNCNACLTHCSTHAFYCGKCDFYVGLKCAQLPTTTVSEGGEEWIQHSCHWHPLHYLKDAKLVVAPCKICRIMIHLEPSCFCSKCDFHVHKSCLEILPQQIDHHYFGCTLILVTTPPYMCILCREDSDSGLAFRSIEIGFKLCMKCFFLPRNKLNRDGTFTSIHHWHQLSLIENLEKNVDCFLCGGCRSRVMYYCRQCKGYFHKACAELPFEIENPLHPQHPLSLISSSRLPESRGSCSLCLREFPPGDTPHSGIYHCKDCNFQLDRKCASTCIPSIRYQGEPHLLTVVEYMYGQEDCRVCSASCKGSTNVFRCSECRFSLHLWCGPLPCEIKHPCHVHPLTFEDFYAEENYTDKFPCYVCEEVRDPMLPVYRCAKGCPMICEIQCAIAQVMPKLLGHHGGDVELRTTFPNVESKVIPRDEILKDMADVSTTRRVKDINLTFEAVACSRDYNWETTSIIEVWEKEMLRSHEKELEAADEKEDADMNNYSFTREAFGRFSSKLGHTLLTLKRDGIPEFILQHRGPEGEVYLIPKSLVPVYKDFFGKYNILGRTSTRWRGSKPYFSSILCAVIHNMRTTKVVDVTSERVRQWLTLLDLVEQAGFDVGFMFEKMKHVWEAHFLIKAKSLLDDTSDQLHREHERLSRREEELLRELEDTRKKKEKIKEQEEDHHCFKGNGMKSLRKEYAQALLIKWKPASTVILESEDQPQDESESSYSTEVVWDASATTSQDSWMTSSL